MSADVIYPSQLVNNFVNKLPTGDRYGEVFINQQRAVVLRCSLCNVEYRVYQEFLEHILDHYYIKAKKSIKAVVQQRVQEIKKETANSDLEEQDISEDIPLKPDNLLVEELAMSGDFQNNKEMEDTPLEEQAIFDSSDSSCAPSAVEAPKRKHIKTSKLSLERRYKCETCGVAFKSSSNCHSHTRRHTGLKPHSCQHCGKKFYTNTERATHERRHTDERPFVCSSCGQRFFTSGTLNRHERRHIGHRPCKCDVCDKEFFDTTRLREHLVVHTKERSHVCTVCNSAFARLRGLKTHMKLHANAREYRCMLCDMAFNQAPALSMHKKNKHKLVSCSTSKLKDENVSAVEGSNCNKYK